MVQMNPLEGETDCDFNDLQLPVNMTNYIKTDNQKYHVYFLLLMKLI